MIRPLLISAAIVASAPVAAKDFYGAIAFSPATQKWGRAWNLASEADAKSRALNECKKVGGTHCEIAVWVKNGCGAFAIPPQNATLKSSGISWGYNDHGTAKARALEECQKRNKGDSCKVITSFCAVGN